MPVKYSGKKNADNTITLTFDESDLKRVEALIARAREIEKQNQNQISLEDFENMTDKTADVNENLNSAEISDTPTDKQYKQTSEKKPSE